MKKTMINLTMIIGIALMCCQFGFAQKAYAISANDSSVFLKQPADGDGTCTFTSCLNMFRRRAVIDGLSDWRDITHSNYKDAVTTDGATVRWTITNVKGMNGGRVSVSDKTTAQKKEYFKSMLTQHPEGIVIYCGSGPMHTVLLTDYTDGIFYCIETLNSYPTGRIPLTSTYIAKYSGLTQDAAVAKISQIWYVTNKSGGSIVSLPKNVTISANAYEFHVGETVIFSCSAEGASGYAIGIDKNGERIYTGDINNTFKMSFSEAGNYSAYVTAWNSAGGVNSSKINFYVYDDISASVKNSGNEYTVEVELHGIDVPCDVFAAGYTGDNLTDIKSKTYNQNKITFNFSGDINNFRIFVWDSETMKPLCPDEAIPYSEWTIA